MCEYRRHTLASVLGSEGQGLAVNPAVCSNLKSPYLLGVQRPPGQLPVAAVVARELPGADVCLKDTPVHVIWHWAPSG